MTFEFDLENAEIELKHINNLLCVYQDFFDNEAPKDEANAKDAELAALIFVNRAHQFRSLIYAAQDKLIAMRKEMSATIKKQYSESKKKGGKAA